MHLLRQLLILILLSGLTASCGLIEDDALPPCEQGVYLRFRYDRNLERANMFPDHVGGVSVYIYDEQGKFVKKAEQYKVNEVSPFKVEGYSMYLDLPVGRYQYVVLANQKRYASTLLTPGAKQRINEPAPGDDITALRVDLDHASSPNADGLYPIENAGMPLDTLWHGMTPQPVEVQFEKVTGDTVYLTRDTKQINVTLRDIELPTDIDVADFDFRIVDRNATIRYNNDVDESLPVLYTPFSTWNTTDRNVNPSVPAVAADDSGSGTPTVTGRIAHAAFMTSRILYHDEAAEDAQLIVRNRKTGVEIIRVDLADLLSRLRSNADRYYSPQEFLDRGYDYNLTFFLQGNRWKYVNVEISALSWAHRVQHEDL